MFYLYVLRSIKDGNLYIGVSKNPNARLEEHNKGKSKSTKYRRPFRLIYFEEFDDKSGAYRKEWHIKNTKEGRIDLLNKLSKLR